jgi:hypothetical protein
MVMPMGRMNIKAPSFGGTGMEQIANWIWKMEAFLRTSRVAPEDYFYNAIFSLTGDANYFVYSLILKNGGKKYVLGRVQDCHD